MNRMLIAGVVATVVVVIVVVRGIALPARGEAIPADGFISGQVLSDGGVPEAGVWVIAESDEVMPNDGRAADIFRKIVVTNDEGRFVLPELPDAQYELWVRGYGLLDSKPVWNHPSNVVARPGDTDIVLNVQKAPTPQEAAKVYPANYWYSLLELPSEEEIGDEGSGIGPNISSQGEYLNVLKQDCNLCHQIGNAATRLTRAEAFDVAMQKVTRMIGYAHGLGYYNNLMQRLGEWGRRINLGETPEAPPRPQGIERNLVITQWETGDIFSYMHDLTAVDRRNPESNPYGPVYIIDIAADWLYIHEPSTNSWSRKRIPIHPEGKYVQSYAGAGEPGPAGHTSFRGASTHSFARPHNPMLDEQGRVWLTTWNSGGYVPEFCPDDTEMSPQSLTVYDPETEEFDVIPTCFGNHHLEFADNGVLYTSGDGVAVGWFEPSLYDSDDPSSIERAQGWSLSRVDSDGDSEGDTQIRGFHYGVYPSPDGSVWYGVTAGTPGHIEYFDPDTDRHEIYKPPFGSGPRGVSVDSNGHVWTALAGSGHLARFDRSKCQQTWGLGDQCPEGWTLWKTPGPTFKGFESDNPAENANADMHYYLWVDRYNTSGLGENTVIVNGTSSDSQLAFNPTTEEWTILRVPFPLNYYTRLIDGRIDDPDAGWKGRALWSNYSGNTNLHTETLRPALVKMQIRPDPLAY